MTTYFGNIFPSIVIVFPETFHRWFFFWNFCEIIIFLQKFCSFHNSFPITLHISFPFVAFRFWIYQFTYSCSVQLKMPTFVLYTNLSKEKIPEGFLLDASKFIAQRLGKPEGVSVVITLYTLIFKIKMEC